MLSDRSPADARVDELLTLYGAPDASLATLLCDRHDPGAIAYRIVSTDMSVRDLSYGELRRDSERFAAALRSLGVGPGDRVATLMGKSREYLIALMGIWRLGAIHLPLFTAFAPPAIALRTLRSGVRVIVCDAAQRAKLMPGDAIPADACWKVVTTGPVDDDTLSFHELLASAQPGIAAAALGGDAPIIQIYTSGTTGEPKAVMVPLRAVAAFRVYAEYALGLRPDDLYWCAADPGWAYGLYVGVLANFATGTPSLLYEGTFSPEATMSILANQGVTNLAAAPTVYRAMRASGVTPPSPLRLRRASSAGEPLTPDVNIWTQHALGVAVHDHYGQTEAGMLINNHHHPDLTRPIKPASMGRAMPGWSATILHETRDEEVGTDTVGRVAMRLAESPLAWFAGYENDPAKTLGKFTPDRRWFLTGDIGRMDSDGDFHFSSRDDDVIIMAGYRIGPSEVEQVMATHPAVFESAIIAVPDTVRGEVMEAFVVLSGDHTPTPELAGEIQQWVKTRYAAHAYPRRIHFIGNLPKTPSGKVQRFVLKQRRLAELAVPTA